MKRLTLLGVLVSWLALPGGLGAQWQMVNGPALPRVTALSAHPLRPDELLVEGPASILLSTDRGATFQVVAETSGSSGNGRFYRHPQDPELVFTREYLSDDGGRTWSAMDRSFDVLAVAPGDPNLIFGITNRGGSQNWIEVLISTSRGQRFTTISQFAHSAHQRAAYDLCVDAVDADRLFAIVGENLGDRWSSLLYGSTDAGRTWAPLAGPEAEAVGVACDPREASVLYVLTPSGLFRSGDGGATYSRLWTGSGLAVHSGNRDELLLSPDGTGAIWIKGGNTVWSSIDGGTSWTAARLPWSGSVLYPSLAPVFGTGRRAYASNGEGIAYSEDAGQSWTETTPPPTPAVLSYLEVDPTDSARVYTAECCHGPFFRTADAGLTWAREDFGVNGIFVDPADADHVYILSGGQGLAESQDAGLSWDDLGDWRAQTGTAGDTHVSAFAFSPDDPETLIIGAGGYDYFDETDPDSWGHVFVSQDGGRTWSRTAFSQPNWAILGVAVAPGSPQTMVVATSNVGIYRSIDGGTSWEQVWADTGPGGRHFLSPRMRTDPTNPGLIVVSLSELLVSEDFGVSWSSRTPGGGAPPSVLITHPTTDLTRLVVPGNDDGVIYVSDDLGWSWDRAYLGINDRIQMLAATREGWYWAVTRQRGVARGTLP
jgi:photosystem II stability/assembly factor-like uncharacterized protein